MNGPEVRIYRGIPGAGKSTLIERELAGTIVAAGNVIVSADFFWIRSSTGEYLFDPKRLGEAHAWCFREYLEALRRAVDRGSGVIYVDNTNTQAWEVAPYALTAAALGVPFKVVTVWCDLAVAARRNVHGVPGAVMTAKYRALLTETLPPHWPHEVIYP